MTKKLKPQHILHRIKPWRFSRDPFRRAQGASRKNLATRCTMREFKALGGSAKNYGVLANYITFTN
jgi:hypothetical protein